MTRLTSIGVLVTRPEHQAHHLCQLIEAEGGAAVQYPGTRDQAAAGSRGRARRNRPGRSL